MMLVYASNVGTMKLYIIVFASMLFPETKKASRDRMVLQTSQPSLSNHIVGFPSPLALEATGFKVSGIFLTWALPSSNRGLTAPAFEVRLSHTFRVCKPI